MSSYSESLYAAQRAQLAQAEEARAVRCDWLATEPCPDDWADDWADPWDIDPAALDEE